MEDFERVLRNGIDVFDEWPDETVRRKYGHLIKAYARLPDEVVEEEDEDEHFAPNSSTDFSMEEEEEEEETNPPHHTSKED